MGKYKDLIDELQTPERNAAFEALLEADGRANAPLCNAVLNHPVENVREDVAEILGDRGSAKAIPVLIDALADDCVFVRRHAMWSIERTCGMEISALDGWLDIDFEKPKELKQKVRSWWNLVRRFIQRDEFYGGITSKRESLDRAVAIVLHCCLTEIPKQKRTSRAAVSAEVERAVSRVLDRCRFE